MSEPALFEPLTLRGLTLKNRVVVSPMCQYSAVEGAPTDWHFVHLGRFAVGGAGTVFVEATGVEARGRITHGDMGLYNDEQQAALARIAAFVKSQGATPGIQLAHAGRKASTQRPWQGGDAITKENMLPGEPPWTTVAPSAIPFKEGWHTPEALSLEEIAALKEAWVSSTKRALAAGFEIVEIHAAHGYLFTEFLSPVANKRTDAYGGSRENRMRFLLEVTEAVRAVWPEDRPLFVRISAVDGTEGGWTLEDSVVLAKELKARGVDVVDCSSGGATPSMATINRPALSYQVPYAEALRREADLKTMAVGLIVDAHQAEEILTSGQADLVALGREMLDDPNWTQHARATLAPEKLGDKAWPDAVGYAIPGLYKAKARAKEAKEAKEKG
ncbi:NADH:flavin oxidoreductase/NADH oxidase [Chondromyces apiculatus]|uniref:NADH:flavin oxidoreductase/NADH oxidase n=1 Tax=Chondromyces apiculatus DSM 436 TaxID=1192034 RepID=A0A017T142_9BACT|nr:NADH:flavin oxidoreductase/NADH oxidase [Chondromyces apiculatus]EYF02717.1 NADH:flavin oxidoreductase/NADH oxidase [Chondromyces apiculatus DSM 436]